MKSPDFSGYIPCDCGGEVQDVIGSGRTLDGCIIPDDHKIPTCIVCGDMFTNEDDLEIARDNDSDECDDSSYY